jgi:thiosulfate/3-mercaptopyruvate sulfurtransferase
MAAARAWWTLRYFGHPAVAVLDGGLAAWEGPVESGEPATPQPGDFVAQPGAMPVLDADAAADLAAHGVLLDARAPERYRGEIEPLDVAAGHIPGALNRFFQRNLQPDGRFKPAGALRAEFDALLGQRGADQVVHQCGSGVTACHNLLAMEHAGLSGSQLYPGSWSEWSSDPARPVARSA